MGTLQFCFIQLQCLLLCSFRRIGHIALPRFLDTEDITDKSTADEHFTEESTTFLVFQTVDGEYLTTLHISKSKNSLDVIETLLEFSLVKQHNNIRVVDDSFLDDGTTYDVLQFLSHHTDHRPELSGGLIEILDVLCHHRRGDGFPCLLDD